MKRLVSLVVPMYDESKMVELFFEKIIECISSLENKYRFEILIINDGSTDDTFALLTKIYDELDNVSLVNLSRNFGHEGALAAGLSKALGEAIIVMDADLQDPVEIIAKLLDKWQEGYDVVNAKRSDRRSDSYFKRKTAALFYRTIRKFSGKIDIPENVGNYRLISRKVLDEINRLPEKNRVFRVLVPYAGYKTTSVEFVRAKRPLGETHYNLKSMMSLAGSGMASATTAPLKWTITIGAITLIFGLIGLIVVVTLAILKFIFPDINQLINFEPGWASIIATILFIGGVQLLFLGVIGSYIGQMFNEVKNRPAFIIDEYLPLRSLEKSEVKQ